MHDIYRLIYTSRNLLEGDEDEQSATVAGILAVSKRNNARVGVTGALLFNAGSFAQVLEGPRAAVETTFERIQRDPRHSDVSVLQCEPVAERGFPNWSMGFVGRSPRGRALWDEIARRTDFDLGRIEGDKLFATLLAIVREDEGAVPLPVRARVAGLDVERLRVALAGRAPEERRAAPQPADAGPAAAAAPPRPATGAGSAPPVVPPVAAPAAVPAPDHEAGVLRAALAEERGRTTTLRHEIDEARIALAAARSEVEKATRDRDIWSDRARALAAALCRDPDADEPPLRRTAPAEPGARPTLLKGAL